MGAPKSKWTSDEEKALRVGVEKYGPGRWRAIQKDSELGPVLMTRSNVDLKVRVMNSLYKYAHACMTDFYFNIRL